MKTAFSLYRNNLTFFFGIEIMNYDMHLCYKLKIKLFIQTWPIYVSI